jgi:hypothetical protein
MQRPLRPRHLLRAPNPSALSILKDEAGSERVGARLALARPRPGICDEAPNPFEELVKVRPVILSRWAKPKDEAG